ncbi:CASP-like protein 1E1 [Elaeis guineensis]|uniref:CASP-like protein 1E1 n=1 Tax=Elaeis guineensis var. tenera TaxID=51953 RepID=UPI003C6DB528
MQVPGYLLRIVAIVLSFISAIVMGVAKEAVTVIVSNDLARQLILWQLALLNRGGSRRIAMHLSIADLVMVVLLFSSTGAAAAISVVADKGLPRYAWPKFCYVFIHSAGILRPPSSCRCSHHWLICY